MFHDVDFHAVRGRVLDAGIRMHTRRLQPEGGPHTGGGVEVNPRLKVALGGQVRLLCVDPAVVVSAVVGVGFDSHDATADGDSLSGVDVIPAEAGTHGPLGGVDRGTVELIGPDET